MPITMCERRTHINRYNTCNRQHVVKKLLSIKGANNWAQYIATGNRKTKHDCATTRWCAHTYV